MFCLLAYPKAGIRRSSIRRLCPFEGSFAKGGFLPSCFPPNMFQLFSPRGTKDEQTRTGVRMASEGETGGDIVQGRGKGVGELEKEEYKNLDII